MGGKVKEKSHYKLKRKRKALWIGFGSVLAPLLVMLILQYRWLGDLEDASAIARRATLENYLDLVAEKAALFYIGNAEQALRPPFSMLSDHQELEKYYHKRSQPKVAQRPGPTGQIPKSLIRGIQLIFVKNFESRDEPLFMYDPKTGKVTNDISQDMAVKVKVANLYWSVVRKKKRPVDYREFKLEDDPEYPIILNPIFNDQETLAGVAGMVLDRDYFSQIYLPELFSDTLPKLTSYDDVVLAVHDSQNNMVFTDGYENCDPTAITVEDQVSRSLDPFFPDWQISLLSRGMSMRQVARTNFLFNMSLSVLLALLLLGGTIWALRTVSREMMLSEMKNDFVSNVSHELRTPLAAIRAFGEMLRMGRFRDKAKAQEYGEFIDTESRRLTQLINNILDFSKIESGQKTYRMEPADINDVLVHVLRTFEVRAQHDGLELVFEPDDVPDIRIDANAMIQALGNLVDNAIKYRGNGKTIRVVSGSNDRHAIISVIDEGIGIAPGEREKIFERFHRVGTGLVHDVKGNGLGLSIVKHIIEAHNGRVVVESEVGRGSKFTIMLPLEGQPVVNSNPVVGAVDQNLEEPA